MQPVFTAAEMRALDARAIETLNIPGPRLMENAGRGAAAVIAREWAPVRGRRILVLCGKGNNGGDGFVVARHLKTKGARPRVLLVGLRSEVTGDARQALERWRGKVEEIHDEAGLATVARALAEADLVVDALLGTGLTGAARGLTSQVIEQINRSTARSGVPVVSLDLPSGLGSDSGALLDHTVRATLTITFAGLKRSLLLQPAAEHAGRVVVVPIGVPDVEVARGVSTFLIDESDVRQLFPAAAGGSSQGHLRSPARHRRVGGKDGSGGAGGALRAQKRGGALHRGHARIPAADRGRLQHGDHDRAHCRDGRPVPGREGARASRGSRHAA
jgi:NAD(P)H-hydrate epimerase